MSVSKRVFLLSAVVLIAGCRTSARIKDVPRVDLELSGAGNRGYLLGTPPEGVNLQTTRQILEADIEIPSYYKPKARPSGAGLAEFEESGANQGAIAVGRAGEAPETGPMDSYVVQPGDTLSRIAAKPEIYGKATKWNRLLKANYELLKGDPKRLRAGMTIKIPRGAVEKEESVTRFEK